MSYEVNQLKILIQEYETQTKKPFFKDQPHLKNAISCALDDQNLLAIFYIQEEIRHLINAFQK